MTPARACDLLFAKNAIGAVLSDEEYNRIVHGIEHDLKSDDAVVPDDASSLTETDEPADASDDDKPIDLGKKDAADDDRGRRAGRAADAEPKKAKRPSRRSPTASPTRSSRVRGPRSAPLAPAVPGTCSAPQRESRHHVMAVRAA